MIVHHRTQAERPPGSAAFPSGEEAPIFAQAFWKCGLASLDDIETPEWRTVLRDLELAQALFARRLPEFRSPRYRWPDDPLHRATRVWEYPYVVANLRAWRRRHRPRAVPRVVDLGSGVTFLPFALIGDGFEVIAVDRDPVCAEEFEQAIPLFPHASERLSFRMVDGARLPLEDRSVDAVVCISVLEHVDDPAALLSEAARVLAPDGLFALTVDLDLTGSERLGPSEYERLRRSLFTFFTPWWPEQTPHPSRLLTSDSSPYGYAGLSGARRALLAARDAVRRVLSPRGRWRERVSVATFGACLRPRRRLP